jgi:hypothetical protein
MKCNKTIYPFCLSNVCTLNSAYFHVKAVNQIYTSHVDFRIHFHIKTCRLQITFSH